MRSIAPGYHGRMPLVLALAGGSLIFAVFILLVFVGAAYTVYSKSGGGIDSHPIGSDPDPGTGREQDESGLQDPDHEEFKQTFDDRGAR